ncbi:MAG TPA: Ig-like domain-containing protein, partial [Gemmatimonadales bacterium]|nr:Ig-like domain-containing protein [Gemmatimonadales bacterium]
MLPSFANVRIDPPSMQLMVGASYPLTVIAYDQAGDEIGPESLSWSTSDPRVVVVSPTGRLTATGPGSATVRAQLGAASDFTAVGVLPVSLRSIRVLPPTVSVPVGSTTPFSASGID